MDHVSSTTKVTRGEHENNPRGKLDSIISLLDHVKIKS